MKTNTTGTVIAKINGRPDYNGNWLFKLFLDSEEDFLEAWSAQDDIPNHECMITLKIPYKGSVTGETYNIDGNYSNTETAKASYMDLSIGAKPYTATSGKLTLVNVNMEDQTATCSFKFIAEWGKEKVEISEGLCDLKGFDARLASENKVSIPELSGAHQNSYEANQFDLSWRQKLEVGMPHDNWNAWSGYYSSDIPRVLQSVFAVKIADHLTAGTFDLITHKDEVHVQFSDVYPDFLAFETESGTLTLELVPQKGSSEGVLKGFITDYKGKAETSNGTKEVSFETGTFLIDGNTARV